MNDLEDFCTPITTDFTPSDIGKLTPKQNRELDRRLIELARARQQAWRELCWWWPMVRGRRS